MSHTFRKPQDPPALDIRPYRNIPNGLAREVNGLTMAAQNSEHTFIDARLQTVAMPVMDGTGKPRWNNAYVSSSSREIVERSIVVPYTLRMMRSALLIIVRLESPRKSILSRPSSSTGPIGNCVATTPFCAISNGI